MRARALGVCVSDIKYEERDVSSLCFFGLLLPGNEVVNVNQKKKQASLSSHAFRPE